MAAINSATLSATALSGSTLNSSMRRKSRVVFIEGLNSFGGLKAHNNVATLGLPNCTDKSFSVVMNSVKSGSLGKKGRGGGALSSTCNAAAEIFKIAAIMNGLTLVGVAVGFVLLRIEAIVEEE